MSVKKIEAEYQKSERQMSKLHRELSENVYFIFLPLILREEIDFEVQTPPPIFSKMGQNWVIFWYKNVRKKKLKPNIKNLTGSFSYFQELSENVYFIFLLLILREEIENEVQTP